MSQKRNAIITGSSSGIGKCVAEAYAKAGYGVCLCGIEEEGVDVARSIAKNFDIPAVYLKANLCKVEEIQKLYQFATQELGDIDTLFNNAGIQHVSPIEYFSTEKWNDIIALNLSATFHLSRLAWPSMKKNNFGRIINLVSVHGLRASEFKSAYVSAKHGVIGLTKVLALEGAPFNITANSICPGYVRTPLVDKQIVDQAAAHNLDEIEVIDKILLKKQAVKDFIPIERISSLALYLSDEASGTITGSPFILDGGWTAQ